MNVLVIGAGGTMGRGIAVANLIAGNTVFANDTVVPEMNLRDIIMSICQKATDKGKMDVALFKAAKIGKTLQVIPDLSRAGECDFVIESAFEDLELKKRIFAELDALCGSGTVLCTNSSVLEVTKIAALCQNPEMVVGAHFFNPAHIMVGLEIIPGVHTSRDTLLKVIGLGAEMGKDIQLIWEDLAVSTILIYGLINQAAFLATKGPHPATDVFTMDRICQNDLGHRMGPLMTADLIGIDVILKIAKAVVDRFGLQFSPAAIFQTLAKAKMLGAKSGTGFYIWKGGRVEMDGKKPVMNPDLYVLAGTTAHPLSKLLEAM